MVAATIESVPAETPSIEVSATAKVAPASKVSAAAAKVPSATSTAPVGQGLTLS